MIRPPIPSTRSSLIVALLVWATSWAPAAQANVAPDPSWAMHPSPVEPTGVEMRSESIRVVLEDDHARVKGSYVLHNPGEATTLEVGYPDIGQTRGSHIAEVHHEYIRDFAASVDGDEVVTEHRVLGKPGEYVVWRIWPLEFAAGQTRTVQVQFVTDTTVNTDVMPRAYPTETRPKLKRKEHLRSFWYVLETGAGWGGTIGEARIVVDARGHGVRAVLPLGYDFWGSQLSWVLTDLEPDADMGPVIVTYEPGGQTDRRDLSPGKDAAREEFVLARLRRDAGRPGADLNEIARKLAIQYRRDPDWRVRRMARESFVELSPLFLALLEQQPADQEVMHVLAGLGEYGVVEAIPHLLQRWVESPGGRRAPVTDALASMDDPRTQPVFAHLVLGFVDPGTSGDYDRRQAIKAIRALGHGTDPGVSALIVALTDPSVHIRSDALVALSDLTGITDRHYWPTAVEGQYPSKEWKRAQGAWAIWWWDHREELAALPATP